MRLLVLAATSGFNFLGSSVASSVSTRMPFRLVSSIVGFSSVTHFSVSFCSEKDASIASGPTGPPILHQTPVVQKTEEKWMSQMLRNNKKIGMGYEGNQLSRRNLLRAVSWATSMYVTSDTVDSASAYTVAKVEPDEKDTYTEAQLGNRPLRVLWVGAGDMKGVFKGLFCAGNEVFALDLLSPDKADLRVATTYATEHGYQLQFEQGDATNLKFTDETFDVVVSSMFLCQDFNPEVVVSEIKRVLKPGGRFGFYEHVEDIDKVIVGKVFGERSVIRVQYYPERNNVMAGVVKKV